MYNNTSQSSYLPSRLAVYVVNVADCGEFFKVSCIDKMWAANVFIGKLVLGQPNRSLWFFLSVFLWTPFRNVTDWSTMVDFQSSKHGIVVLTWYIKLKFHKTLVTSCNLPNYKVSNQLKSYSSFWIYPSFWTSYLVAIHAQGWHS